MKARRRNRRYRRKRCPANYYSRRGATGCTKCPRGTRSSPAGRICRIGDAVVEDNVDYWGADIKNFRSKGVRDCYNNCIKQKGCVSFSMRKKDNKCWLKKKRTGKRRKTGKSDRLSGYLLKTTLWKKRNGAKAKTINICKSTWSKRKCYIARRRRNKRMKARRRSRRYRTRRYRRRRNKRMKARRRSRRYRSRRYRSKRYRSKRNRRRRYRRRRNRRMKARRRSRRYRSRRYRSRRYRSRRYRRRRNRRRRNKRKKQTLQTQTQQTQESQTQKQTLQTQTGGMIRG